MATVAEACLDSADPHDLMACYRWAPGGDVTALSPDFVVLALPGLTLTSTRTRPTSSARRRNGR